MVTPSALLTVHLLHPYFDHAELVLSARRYSLTDHRLELTTVRGDVFIIPRAWFSHLTVVPFSCPLAAQTHH